MNKIWFDTRFAMRHLRKSPGFTLAAVLTLGFGIAGTTAIFSVVEGVLLRPLPFPQPSRLVAFGDNLEGVDFGGGAPIATAPEIRAYSRDTHSFVALGGYQQTAYALSGAGDPVSIAASRLTASVFTVLAVSPLMGRSFTQEEDEGSQQVTVISYQTWRSRFHADPRIIGQKIELDRKPYEIIGVMPRDFEFPLVPRQLNRSELWVPISLTRDDLLQGATRWDCKLVARLKPGVTLAQAVQEAQPVAQEIMRNFPPGIGGLRIHPAILPLQEAAVAQARPLVRMLFLAVAVVLFIACANLAGLLLVRVIRRRREIAIRLALGASGSAVVRQSLVEALVLSMGGGLLGLALASSALHVGINLLPETLPRVSAIALDWLVVGFAILLAVSTGAFCGLIPAIAAAHTAVSEALKEGGRTGTAGARHARLRSILVVAQVAVALVLLIAAGLLMRSFDKMRSVDLGFKADHTITAAFGLPQQQYSTQAAVDAFNSALLNKLQQLPGVEAVGATTMLPAAGQNNNWNTFVPEGYVPSKGEGVSQAWAARIMGSYFRAAGISILRGRDFNDADRANSPLVVIVNRKLAERYWPGQNPIGKRLHWGLPESQVPWMTVVGEIGDVKETSADADTRNQLYTVTSQTKASAGRFADPSEIDGNFDSLVVRNQEPPEQTISSLRATVRSLDPQLPLTQVESMEQLVAEGQVSRRFNTVLISSFAAVALLLALLGIYSVIAFTAAMRAQEMAIRLALGSQRSSVILLVLASGAKLGLAGCGIGAMAAVFATRLLRSMLFEVDPLDPFVILLAALSIFVLALAASIVPSHRAASIDPVEALRAE